MYFENAYEELVVQKNIRSYFRESRVIYSNMDYNLRLLCDGGRNYSTEDDGSEYIDYPALKELQREPWYQKLGENSSSIKYIPAYVSRELRKTEDDSAMRAVRLIKNLNSGRVLGIMEVKYYPEAGGRLFSGEVWKKRVSRCF